MSSNVREEKIIRSSSRHMNPVALAPPQPCCSPVRGTGHITPGGRSAAHPLHKPHVQVKKRKKEKRRITTDESNPLTERCSLTAPGMKGSVAGTSDISPSFCSGSGSRWRFSRVCACVCVRVRVCVRLSSAACCWRDEKHLNTLV